MQVVQEPRLAEGEQVSFVGDSFIHLGVQGVNQDTFEQVYVSHGGIESWYAVYDSSQDVWISRSIYVDANGI